MKSNLGSSVKVELCRDELQEKMKVSRGCMFVCLRDCKKGWKAGYRPIIGLVGELDSRGSEIDAEWVLRV